MIVHDDLFVIFTSMSEVSDEKKETGVPKSPLFVWIYGAWYKKRNVTTTVVKERYRSLFGLDLVSKNRFWGPFNSEDELRKFFYIIAEELQANSIRLVSKDQFNNCIKQSGSLAEIQSSLGSYSEQIKNLDNPLENMGLIQKIFNKNK